MSSTALAIFSTDADVLKPTLKALTTEQLYEILAQGLVAEMNAIVQRAHVIKELEDRGERISKQYGILLQYLRQVAVGLLLPEVLLEFRLDMQLFVIVANLSVPEQRRLLNDGTVEVYVDNNGGSDVRRERPSAMTPFHRKQVFAKGHIRSLAEQRDWIETQREKEKQKVIRSQVVELDGWKADKERGGIYKGRLFISQDKLVKLLQALRA